MGPILADSIVLNLVRSKSVEVCMFDSASDICVMDKEVKKKLICEFNSRVTLTENSYRQKIETRCKEYKSMVLNYNKKINEVA